MSRSAPQASAGPWPTGLAEAYPALAGMPAALRALAWPHEAQALAWLRATRRPGDPGHRLPRARCRYCRRTTRIAAVNEEQSMKNSEGTIDRALRVIAGLVLIALTLTGTIGVWGWIGVVPVLTGLLGWCPVYTLLGLNTCPMKAR